MLTQEQNPSETVTEKAEKIVPLTKEEMDKVGGGSGSMTAAAAQSQANSAAFSNATATSTGTGQSTGG